MVYLVLLYSALVVWICHGVLLRNVLKHGPFIRPDTFEPRVEAGPSVSVVVPARNEEHNIAGCLDTLIAQDYPELEIIVVDDRSSDRTAEIVRGYVARDPRVTLVQNSECPEGWTGKNHAAHLGAARARGAFILFVDADTRHVPENISQTVSYMLRNNVDMLSLIARYRNETFWQKLLQPVAGILMVLSHRLSKVNDPNLEEAFGNGQYILIRRDAYEKIGGRRSIRSELMDMALAQRVKQAGLRYRLVYGMDISETRSYRSFHGLWQSWTRIFYAGMRRSLRAMTGAFLRLLVVDVLPYLVLLGAAATLLLVGNTPLVWWLFGLGALVVVTEQLVVLWSYRTCRTDLRYVLLHFPACVLVAAMMAAAVCKLYSKDGITWKGQRYPNHVRTED